jgi:hypothetical protein
MSRIPPREWLAVVYPPVVGAGLLAIAASAATSTEHGWLIVGAAATAGAIPPLVYTAILAREKRLFLRDRVDVERNRSQIERISVPIGWTLAAALLVTSALVGGFSTSLIASLVGGAILGFWPGLLANFLRLRREKWSR